MGSLRATRILQAALALFAAAFGTLTILAGMRVLGGGDPGYVVFRPLLLYNTAMGFMYVLSGFLIWRSVRPALRAAAAIFLLNLLVLMVAANLYSAGQGVALDSVTAMALRTGVWLALMLGVASLGRRPA